MFFRIYKYNHPIIIVIIFFTAILLWLPAILNFVNTEPIVYSFEMPLYYYIIHLISDKIFTVRIISLILVLLLSIQLNRLNTKFFILEFRSYLPSFIFILGCSILPLQNLPGILFAGLCFLLAINRIFSTYRNDNAWMNFFDAGLLISIGGFFYNKLLFFIILIWISMLILRPFRGREWIVSLIGFLLPFLFAASYFYLFEDNLQYKILLFINDLFSFEYSNIKGLTFYIYCGFLFFLTIFSSIHIINNLQKRKVSIRKYFQLFFWIFVIVNILLLLGEYNNQELFLIVMIPLSYIISSYILSIKSIFWTEIIMTIYVGIIILIQLVNFTGFTLI